MLAFVNLVSHLSQHICYRYKFERLCIKLPKSILFSRTFTQQCFINLSIQHGIVPDEMKIARVIPIFKSDDQSLFTNYRPISVLPSFSKFFERVIYNRLMQYLMNFNILCSNQYGFRKNHSTALALIDLHDLYCLWPRWISILLCQIWGYFRTSCLPEGIGKISIQKRLLLRNIMLFLLVLLLKRTKTWFTNLIRITTTESLSTTAPYKRLIDGLSYVYVRTPQLR